MEISPINGATVPVSAGNDVSPKIPAEHRPIVQAVKALNATAMFGEDNHLTFRKDQASQRMVLQVINSQTKEVVLQIPPEYVLQLAEDLKTSQTDTADCKSR